MGLTHLAIIVLLLFLVVFSCRSKLTSSNVVVINVAVYDILYSKLCMFIRYVLYVYLTLYVSESQGVLIINTINNHNRRQLIPVHVGLIEDRIYLGVKSKIMHFDGIIHGL